MSYIAILFENFHMWEHPGFTVILAALCVLALLLAWWLSRKPSGNTPDPGNGKDGKWNGWKTENSVSETKTPLETGRGDTPEIGVEKNRIKAGTPQKLVHRDGPEQ
ncbi:MAG: hypothetical protein ACOYB8_03775 [Eubacteriaceae bacterium]